MFLRPFHFIPADTKIDFVSKRWWAFSMSIFLLVVTAVMLCVKGLNFGIDFEGGILIEAKAPHTIEMASLRQTLSNLDLGEVSLQQFGGPDDVMIRVQRQAGGEAAQMKAIQAIRDKLGPGYDYRRMDVVGPTVGRELLHAGILATLLAMAAISIYVAVRFEWQFGLAALIATFHDVLTTVGLYAVLHLDFNLTSVAALLTLAGYSINDTVVVFDRIREDLRRHKATNLRDVINEAVNQTLSRTTMTAGTTLLALLPLLFFGGPTLLNFSAALTWGIVVGTYSSIYVAAALLLYMPPLKRIEKR
ncbi:MAG TPA: protein translocase subunit SecF [Alphaproteobacteria bacterium]|nr:protein translocase subunit SecF [Alphaproteobacteria bacterium]